MGHSFDESPAESAGLANQDRIHKRRHVEWKEHRIEWSWLLDSYEGGEAYINAVYGTDSRGFPRHNLVRHRREYPDPDQGGPAGAFAASIAPHSESNPAPSWMYADDDFEMRKSRTPVPSFVSEAVELHLSRIYSREIAREGPEPLQKWWDDVDGKGTPVDVWMEETIAPLLFVLGQIDILFEPPASSGPEPENAADVDRMGLRRCIVSHILPDNMLWWRLGPRGEYLETLNREYFDDEQGNRVTRYRHWTVDEWTLYDAAGEKVASAEHGYGAVPIIRFFDRRKQRTTNVGRSRYDTIAQLQREYYNRDSELILSDSLQAHPILQVPSDMLEPGNTIAVGPGYVLPMIRNPQGSNSGGYQPNSFISPSKDPAESIRLNKADMREAVDRNADLLKPAGAIGSSARAVAQSGMSKQLDSVPANDRLTKMSRTLNRIELAIAARVLSVLRVAPDESVRVVYPSEFHLYNAAEMGRALMEFQSVVRGLTGMRDTETRMLKRFSRMVMPGLDDQTYAIIDQEIDREYDNLVREAQRLAASEQSSSQPVGLPNGGDPFGRSDDEFKSQVATLR